VDALLSSIRQIPHPWLLIGAAAAVIAVQIAVIVVARRPDGPPLLVNVLAGVAILAVPVAAGVCVHAARATMLAGFEATDPSEKAEALGAGISGQFNTIPFATTAVLIAAILWCVGWKLSHDARGSEHGARSFSPVALVGLGLGACMVGVLQWTLDLIHAFAALAGIPPEAKTALLWESLEVGRRHLETFAQLSRWTTIGLGAVAVVLVVLPRRDGAPAPAIPARSDRFVSAATIAALILSGILVIAARPMRAENEMPWPRPADGDALLLTDPPTPDLEGPDPVLRSPVVMVFVDRIALDGFQTSLDDLGGMLATLRTNFMLLHPGETFDGNAIVLADPKTPRSRLASVLKILHAGEYSQPSFSFTKAEALARPVFGTLRRVHATAARVALVDEGGETRTSLRLADFQSYDAFARQVVALRRSGHDVALALGK
jgi:hypothetical protein